MVPTPYVSFVDPRKDLGSGVSGFLKRVEPQDVVSNVTSLVPTGNMTNVTNSTYNASATSNATTYFLVEKAELASVITQHTTVTYSDFMFKSKSLIFELTKKYPESYTWINNFDVDGNITGGYWEAPQ